MKPRAKSKIAQHLRARPLAHKEPKHDCTPKPSVEKCREPMYLDQCGMKWKSLCREPTVEGLEEHYDDNPSPLRTMFKPKRRDIPSGLRQGKTVEYEGPKKKKDLVGNFPRVTTIGRATTAKSTIPSAKASSRSAPLNGTAASKYGTAKRATVRLSKSRNTPLGRVSTSDNIFSRTGLTRPPQSGLGITTLPSNAHRQPSWQANGNKVTSCEEYGYEMTYDWARFTDATAACSGDHVCELDIAFLPSTPGIADRTLRSKDGTPLATQTDGKKKLQFPKNTLFTVPKLLLYATEGAPMAASAEMKALEKAVKDGSNYYSIGCKGASCGNTPQFDNEWDWHRQLYTSNRDVTEAEFEEYELRKAHIRDLLAAWGRAVQQEKDKILGPGKRGAVKPFDNPLEHVSDPLRQMVALKTESAKLAGASTVSSKAKTRGKATTHGKQAPPKVRRRRGKLRGTDRKMRREARKKARHGALDPALGGEALPTTVMGSMAGPGNPNPWDRSKAAASGTAGKTASLTTCHPSRFGGRIQETVGRGPISCMIGKAMREEWARIKRGEKSCLDLNNDDCDWSPAMFEQRFVKGVPYIAEQNAHETYCQEYTFDKINQTTLKNATEYIDGRKAAITKALRELAPYMKDFDPEKPDSGSPSAFGWQLTDADHFGDKSLMGAGYDYTLGWDVGAIKSPDSDVCSLGGGARGAFGVDGWLIGAKFEVVDALARADFGRNGTLDGSAKAHMRVFSIDVFDPVDAKFSSAWSEPLFSGGVQIPMAYKPSFYMMAGPVPISGSVWGEFAYGADLRVGGNSKTSKGPGGECNTDQVAFGVTAAFVPYVGLNAKAQVGVGIAGLLSAGIRGMINLVTIGVPVTTALTTKISTDRNGSRVDLAFDLDVRLSVETLSGYISVYVEFLMFEEEFVLFRWNGVGPASVSLLGKPLTVELPVGVMGQG
ncbi:MAG: hypothetical protein AAF721_31560 [Myxococcota bacterium]